MVRVRALPLPLSQARAVIGLITLVPFLLALLATGLVLTNDMLRAGDGDLQELLLTLDPCTAATASLSGAAGLFLPAYFNFALLIYSSGIPSAVAVHSGALFGEPRLRPPAFRF